MSIDKSREKDLIKNTAILGIGAIFSKGLVFLMIPFFSRWLSVDDYGSFDLLSTYITLLIPFVTLSSGEAIFRFLIDTVDDNAAKKRIITNGLAIFFTGSFITVSIAYAVLFCTERIIAIPFCLFLVAEAVNNFALMYLRGIKRLTKYTICNILTMLGIVIFVTVLVFFAKLGLPGMLYGYACGYLVSSIYALWSTKVWNYLDLRDVNWSEVTALIKYSVPLIPNAISWWIINASDRTIINFFLGAAANGVYAIANKVPSLCTTLFNVFNISWQENVSSAINDDDREKYFGEIFANIIKILVSICICIISVDFILFHYIFDIKYLEGMKYVPILITACIFTVVSQFFGGIFIGIKEPKYNGGTTVMSAIVNVVVHLALVKFVGLYAAAISTLVSFAFLCVVRYCIIKKKFDIKIEKSTIIFILIYIYFIFMHYIDYMPINIVNIVIAVGILGLVNKDYAMKFFRKVK